MLRGTARRTAPRARDRIIFALLVAALGTYAAMHAAVLPALPQIQRALDASPSSTAWIFTALLLSGSVATPIVGRLGDLYGKDRALLGTLILLAAGTVVAALAESIAVMLAGRLLQGVGAGLFPLAFGIIRDELPRERIPHAFGVLSAMLGIGTGVGVVVAGPLVDHLSYHWLFWVPVVPLALIAVAARIVVPRSPPYPYAGGVNWIAAAMLSLSLVVVLLTITKASEWGWGAAQTLAGFVLGIAVGAAWVATELRSRIPLIDMAMMRTRGVWTTNVAAFLVGMGLYTAFLLLPQFVQEPTASGYGFGVTAMSAGLVLLPATVCQMLVGHYTGRLERRFGSRSTLVGGSLIAASAFVLLLLARAELWQVYLASALFGAGVGLAFAALANLIVNNVAQHETGAAIGMNNVMRTVGGALGVQLAASVLAAGATASHIPSSTGYGIAFALCAVAFVAATAMALLIPVRGAHQHRDEELVPAGAR